MPVIELLGWMATAFMGGHVIDHPLNTFNEAFARRVDSERSCWTRIAGEPGSYGVPTNYDLDPLCNWRLARVTETGEHTVWKIIRR